MDEVMDRLLEYRNLLCAEDHLFELLNAAKSKEELAELRDKLVSVMNVRKEIGFIESDPNFHCVNKHLAVASEAAREVWTATRSEEDLEFALVLASLSKWSLERLIGREIKVCGRCHSEEEDGGK